ncbi:hypothetical protein OF83DRAFT_334268 [Amylostereum chailletii]|nr:hypothetical protein OF83DRAFT_334268 [Amylostereum chailletii]
MGICRFLPSLAPQATLPNFELLRQLSVRRRPLHRSILTLATSDPSPPFVPTAPPFQNVSAEGSSNLPPAPRSHPESRLSYICPLPPSLPTVEETSEVPTASESPSVPNTIPPFSASSFTTGPSIPNASSPVPAAIHSNSVMNTPVSSLPTSRTPEGRHRSHHSHDGFHVFAEHALKRFHSITHRPSLHLKPKVKRAKSFSDATGSVRSVRPTDREIGATGVCSVPSPRPLAHSRLFQLRAQTRKSG